MSGPRQGTPAQQAASKLLDVELADRIDRLIYNRHQYPKAEADAFLFEAARRLRWHEHKI